MTDNTPTIKIVERPHVYLIGSNEIQPNGLAQFLFDEQVTGQAHHAKTSGEALVETAGRLCYMSFDKPRPGGNRAYIEHILEVGHGSVLEHAVYTLIVTGVSRSLTHELIRHRVGISPSQLSQRFVDESDVAFVLPPALAPLYPAWVGGCLSHPIERWVRGRQEDLEEYKLWAEHLESASTEPDKTLRRKQARETARSVLPNCTETKICLTGNARAWRHMLELRGSLQADAEFRRLTLYLLKTLRQASPILFGDYVIQDGVIFNTWKKV